MKAYCIEWFIASALLFIVVVATTGCAKDRKSAIETGNTLAFDVSVMRQLETESISRTGQSSSSNANGMTNEAGLEIVEEFESKGEEFDVIAKLYGEKQVLSSLKERTSLVNPKAAGVYDIPPIEQLKSGVLYCVLLYENVGNKEVYVGLLNAIVGAEAKSFVVAYGKKYTWYAYSYNSTTNLPQVKPGQANVAIPIDVKHDLLAATGLVTATKQGENKVKLIFEHKMAAIQIVLDTRGAWAPMVLDATKVSVTTNYDLYFYNLLTGRFESEVGLPVLRSTILEKSDWQRANNVSLDTMAMAHLYVPPIAKQIRNFTIQIEALTLRIDDKSFWHLDKPRMHTFTNPVIIMPGGRAIVELAILQSLVQIGDMNWAMGHLYNLNDGKGYKFRRTVSNVENLFTANPKDAGEYWKWMSKFPSITEGYGVIDPCTQAFPAGYYRMPTAAEYDRLIKYAYTPPLQSTGSVGFDNAGCIFPDTRDGNSSFVQFLCHGYRSSTGQWLEMPERPQGIVTSGSAYYWTRDSSGSNLAKVFKYTATGFAIGPREVTTMNKDFSAHIRCVKN